jgi:hypothetical protein
MIKIYYNIFFNSKNNGRLNYYINDINNFIFIDNETC